VSLGYRLRISAATPAAMADEGLVPLATEYPVPESALTISTPGAQTAT
jgi:hypothetical protein